MKDHGTNPYATMRRIILASMILVPFVPFILSMAIGYHYFTTSLETSAISSMERIVEDHRHMIESFLDERKADLQFILHSYRFDELTQPGKLHDIFEILQGVSDAFVDLGIFNAEGVHLAYQGPYELTGKIYRDADWFKEVMKEGSYMSDVFLGYRRVPHFVIALAKEDNGRKWIIRATIDTQLFNDLVKRVRIGKTGEAYILNADRILQTERRFGAHLMDKDQDNIKMDPDHEGIRAFVSKDAKGEPYLYATTWLKNKKWLLVARQEKSDAFKALISAAYLIVLTAVVGGIGIVGIAFYLTDRIIKRMKEIDTEKEHLSQQLIRASRLAELGEMAAGFAHEINNPLQIIKSEQGLIDAILSDSREGSMLKAPLDLRELDDSFDQIRLQVDRCAKITQAILKFGRKSENIAREVCLRSFIPEIVGMVEKKASVNGIAILQDVDANTPQIEVDPAQLEQVLVNLFNNAMDAVFEKNGPKGGEIVVAAAPGKGIGVEISVKDNGCGISPENMGRIFSPFFTTKPVGKGTGLGLSVCYGIIENMGGVMDVSSEVGVGSIFKISLPAMGQ